jgi:outer membrane receptor for Fe3+-dicitrate
VRWSMLKRWALVFPLLARLLCLVAITPPRAAEERKVMTETERAAKIEELQRRKTALLQELRQLRARPEGTARSTVPRSEMENQPTRSQKESLESVPGVAVRPGGNSRVQELSIRGTSP